MPVKEPNAWERAARRERWRSKQTMPKNANTKHDRAAEQKPPLSGGAE